MLLINEAEIAAIAAEPDAVEQVVCELDPKLRVHVLRHRNVEGAAAPMDCQDARLRRRVKLHINDVFERVAVDQDNPVARQHSGQVGRPARKDLGDFAGRLTLCVAFREQRHGDAVSRLAAYCPAGAPAPLPGFSSRI